MPQNRRQLVAWILIFQVTLIGSIGTGLHDLLGCQHGLCGDECCPPEKDQLADRGHACCGGCGADQPAKPADEDRQRPPEEASFVSPLVFSDCALCDLIAKYHHAAPVWATATATELVVGEAELLRENAIVAAAIRLALSRGPPAA
ncbi:MAG: hypothetical protein AAGJ46_02370 [Planctomycetota bacterium]